MGDKSPKSKKRGQDQKQKAKEGRAADAKKKQDRGSPAAEVAAKAGKKGRG